MVLTVVVMLGMVGAVDWIVSPCPESCDEALTPAGQCLEIGLLGGNYGERRS